MPTDLTGTPTALGIGTYNVDADEPSGLGFNEAMAQIDALIQGRIATPAGVATGEVPVWNGTSWVRSSTLGMSASGISGFPNDRTKVLHGDGSWLANELLYGEFTSVVNIVGTSAGAATDVIDFAANSFDGSTYWVEFFAPVVELPAVAGGFMTIGLFDGGTLVFQWGVPKNPAAAAMWWPTLLRRKFTPSAGSHTYSVKAWVSSTTGTPAIAAGTGVAGDTVPGYLRFGRVS